MPLSNCDSLNDFKFAGQIQIVTRLCDAT